MRVIKRITAGVLAGIIAAAVLPQTHVLAVEEKVADYEEQKDEINKEDSIEEEDQEESQKEESGNKDLTEKEKTEKNEIKETEKVNENKEKETEEDKIEENEENGVEKTEENRDEADGEEETEIEEKETEEEAIVFLEEDVENILTIEHLESGKLLRTYADANELITVDGEEGEEGTAFSEAVFGENDTDTVDGQAFTTVSLVSEDYHNGIASVVWKDGQSCDYLMAHGRTSGDGWETVRVVPNGDGTVSFKDSCFDRYFTVDEDAHLICDEDMTREELTDNEKFILHTDWKPDTATELAVDEASRTQTTLQLSWKNPESLYTSITLYQKKDGDLGYTKIAELADEESYQVTALMPGITYSFKMRVVLDNGDEKILSEYSDEVSATTRIGEKPATPANVELEEKDEQFYISWDAAEGAEKYQVLRAPSRFGEYEVVDEALLAWTDGTDTSTSVVVTMAEDTDKYSNYYRIVAVNGDELSDQSDFVSVEKNMFGEHTLIFAETDDMEKIDEVLLELFEQQNDYEADAQFKGEHWQVYFKPGDYTEASCMYLGFYTSFNGLGKTPYDVKLNNIAIPAYLPGGALGGSDNNATCNFWRSAENLSIIDTGNEQGAAQYGSWRPEQFNWAVAQAAPLRRVYSERPIAYDWNYGWASGGYVADCYIKGTFNDGDKKLSAGTWSGQQFYMRNTKLKGEYYGCTLNQFLQGVEAANNLSGSNAERLQNGNGYTNWGLPADNGGQQIVTDITKTPKISEKPFLYLDDENEYQVFIPDVLKDTRGISWGDDKENDGMGAGESIPLSDFYIASPEDSADTINEQLADGKNIYFTPGEYYAEEVIEIKHSDMILLGSGMASIIPDNEEMAMRVSDKNGIRIAGLIFDAGEDSDYLLQVGKKGTHNSHSSNPIILQDLFFRVGGTTEELTKVDNALEINSDDVICDHFWIWRADHGAGVEWYGNNAQHGLIVNGDRVVCYALFNEHFEEYDTLWNGENGATYFYQNETCYDPISQEAWMSHGGKVKGYASYKVNNDVKRHYAVGLGIYNVFIYTGPTYDATEIAIELENGIEVPNASGVIIEDACTQTFANEEDALQKINHVINGVGGCVSSGYDQETGEEGTGWSRKYVVYYRDGVAKVGLYDESRKGENIGTEILEDIEAPEAEEVYVGRIEQLYDQYSKLKKSDFAAKSWENANIQSALLAAETQIAKGKEAKEKDLDQAEIYDVQAYINKACVSLEAAYEKLIFTGNAQKLYDANKHLTEKDFADGEWNAFNQAMQAVQAAVKAGEEAGQLTKKEIYAIQVKLDKAYERLAAVAPEKIPVDETPEEEEPKEDVTEETEEATDPERTETVTDDETHKTGADGSKSYKNSKSSSASETSKKGTDTVTTQEAIDIEVTVGQDIPIDVNVPEEETLREEAAVVSQATKGKTENIQKEIEEQETVAVTEEVLSDEVATVEKKVETVVEKAATQDISEEEVPLAEGETINLQFWWGYLIISLVIVGALIILIKYFHNENTRHKQ